MRNGMYEYKHAWLSSKVYVKAFNGNLSKYIVSSINGGVETIDYQGRITEEVLKEQYTFVKEIKQVRKFNLVWMMNGVVRETIMRNTSYGLCFNKKNELQRTSHKSGLLLIQRVE